MNEFITLALAHFLALLSPGPDFFLVVQSSVKAGKKTAFFTCLGIALANGIYILLALIGFSLLSTIPMLFTTIQYLGAMYLCYIGFLLLKAPKRVLYEQETFTKKQENTYLKYFFMGFMSALLNPKNSIFYLSVFSVIIHKETAFFVQSLYALWMVFAVLFWDMFVAYSVNNTKTKQFLNTHSFKVEKLSGVALTSLGLAIFFKGV